MQGCVNSYLHISCMHVDMFVCKQTSINVQICSV